MKLKPGVRSGAGAGRDVGGRRSGSKPNIPATNRGRGIQLLPVWQSPFNPMEALLPTLGIALAVVVSVLLIACANVGNLLLVKSFARRREMTIRLAVGAGRGRLVQQLLTEGLILSAFAAAGGLVVGVLVPQRARAAVPAARRRLAAPTGRARLARARAERRRLSGLDAVLRAGAGLLTSKIDLAAR